MNKFIKINGIYFNISGIKNIGFEQIEYKYKDYEIKKYIIYLNNEKIEVSKENYDKIRYQFLIAVGENNIYE